MVRIMRDCRLSTLPSDGAEAIELGFFTVMKQLLVVIFITLHCWAVSSISLHHWKVSTITLRCLGVSISRWIITKNVSLVLEPSRAASSLLEQDEPMWKRFETWNVRQQTW
jgi:hypothetical protein